MSTLLEPLDHLLGTRSKLRLLRVLLERETGVSVRETARLARVSHHAALRALDELEALGVVRRVETGREHLVSINRANYHVRHGLEPLFRAERQRVEAVFERLHRVLSEAAHEAPSEILSATMFGSVARGEDKPTSDLDLLVVVADERAVGPVHRTLVSSSESLARELGLRLSPVVLTLRQIEEQVRQGAGLVTEAMRDGRRAFGEHLADLIDGSA